MDLAAQVQEFGLCQTQPLAHTLSFGGLAGVASAAIHRIRSLVRLRSDQGDCCRDNESFGIMVGICNSTRACLLVTIVILVTIAIASSATDQWMGWVSSTSP
jgi:hypothetical protein